MRHVCLGCLKRSISTFFVPPNTLGYYAFHGLRDNGYAGERSVERQAPILSLLCEHIAILVVLVFLFPIHNRIFSVRMGFMFTLA